MRRISSRGVNRVDVAVAGLPQIAGQADARNQLKRNLRPQNAQPIGLELRSERVETRAPAENLLVNTHDQIEHIQNHKANPHASQIDNRICASSRARGCLGGGTHA